MQDLAYFWVAAGCALLAFFVCRLFFQAYKLLLCLDAIGEALFTIQAIDKVLGLGYAPLIALNMGIITGTGGAWCAK